VADVNMRNANNPTIIIMCNISEEGIFEVCYLDNDCSYQISVNEILFSFIDKTFMSKIKMENNGTISIMGKRSIMVHTKQGEKEIHDMYLAPSMKHNLMTIEQLIQNRYKVLMENDKCVIHGKGETKRLLAVVQIRKN
jgi:hypothetical protein